ncbi:hypothetical protein TWF569_008581 [Orbilia oligospora]|nr:hypothetical protein TWF706_011887 [Orbilia oligospora]KAF3092509.1 hypothetical protein TWF103_011229 [Orbilia oligospora]KAF3139333.1 hypothetical protein TWF569_008581 [Orbilia oligospora]KAF3144896.1 hypothetical protein TWF594_004486 [Orbilia oligospora]
MPWSISEGGILDPAKMFPKSRDRDGSSGGASTSSVDSIVSGTTSSRDDKRDSTGSQSTAGSNTTSRRPSLKPLKSPEKESARQLARNFFGYGRKPSSRSSTPTLQMFDETDSIGPGHLERVNSDGSTTSSKFSSFSIKPGFLSGTKSRSGSVQLRDSSWIEDKVNARTSSKTATAPSNGFTAPLNEAELRQRILQAAREPRCDSPLSPLSPLSPTAMIPFPLEPPILKRPEIPPLPKTMPIVHKKPLGPRENADWDLDPMTHTIEEEDEMLDGLSWIDNDTDVGSKRVSSNDTISEPPTIHSGRNSATSSTAEIPLILDHSCIGPDGMPRVDELHLSESVPILLDIHAAKKERPPPPPDPFLLELQKKENAGLHALCEHLADVPEALLDPIQFFEKRLWALVGCQWLTFGKQLQSPAHDTLLHARPEDGRKVLHLHGPVADGWVLAAKYPNATFYSVSSEDVEYPEDLYSMPSNHHHIYTPSVSSPIPFPDDYFDVVVTRTLSSVVKSSQLESVLRESLRILRPGGWLELHTIDPTLTRAGNITKHWIESRVLAPMENDFFSSKPSDRILHLMQDLGYHKVKNARIALPTFPVSRPLSPSGGAGGELDAQNVMVYLGRHFYEELYGQFLRAGHIGAGSPSWWWDSMAVRQECQRENTCFGLTISFGRKTR